MKNQERMQNLFVQHLRFVYDGEKAMANALSKMSKTTSSIRLERFYKMKSELQEKILDKLKKAFVFLKTESDGETDNIIRAYVPNINPEVGNEFDWVQTATCMLGRAMNVYQVNAYNAAVSCALELGNLEVAELLRDCLNEKKFDKQQINFLKVESYTAIQSEGLSYREIAAA